MKKNGTTGQISESVVLIVFTHGRSNRKSGTGSGTNLVDRRRNRMRFRFRRLSPREKTFPEISAVISCRKSLSRTPVPNLDPGKRCLYWMSRSPGLCGIRHRFCRHGKKHPRRAARQARFPAGFGEAEHRLAVREGIGHNARVAARVRSRAEGGRSRTGEGGRRRKNTGFSPRFRQISAGFISRQE